MKTTKLRLVIDVEYNLNGVAEKDLRIQLCNAAQHLSSNGMLSGYSDAEVETWDYKVEGVK